jgi:hypothetical protein
MCSHLLFHVRQASHQSVWRSRKKHLPHRHRCTTQHLSSHQSHRCKMRLSVRCDNAVEMMLPAVEKKSVDDASADSAVPLSPAPVQPTTVSRIPRSLHIQRPLTGAAAAAAATVTVAIADSDIVPASSIAVANCVSSSSPSANASLAVPQSPPRLPAAPNTPQQQQRQH